MRILFRTEGNHQQGMGDIWGSIALADECARYSDEILFVISGGKEASEVIRGRKYQLRIMSSPAAEEEVLRAFRPDVIIVNKLNSDPAYIKGLKKFAGLIVTMDDTGGGGRWADLRINVLYHIPGAVTDTRNIALRREFQRGHSRQKVIRDTVEELLVTQGGSDTYGFTPKLIRALEALTIRPLCTVVVGPTFQHEVELQTALEASSLNIRVVRNVSNMAELIWNADLAITAGGLTMFEMACLGTPSIVVCGEPFEVETAVRLADGGAVVNLGFGGNLDYSQVPHALYALASDPVRRQTMSLRGKELVDGRGAERIVVLIRKRVAQLGVGHL